MLGGWDDSPGVAMTRFGSLDYGRLTEFTDLMFTALGTTVYITMDDNRRIGRLRRWNTSWIAEKGCGGHGGITNMYGEYDMTQHAHT